MGWRNLVKPLSTADVSGNVVSQKFRHPTRAMVVRMVSIGLAVWKNPAFGNVKMRIYSDRNGSPGKLIAESSTTWTKAQVHTLDNALKFASFLFDWAPLQANTWYHLVLAPSSYTGVDDSFLAWRMSYPDPQYPLIITDDNAAGACRHHLEFNLFGYTLGEAD